MKSLRFRFASVLLTAVAVGPFVAGCSDDDDDDVAGPPVQQGNLEVFIADAPPEFDQLEAVNMTITRIEAVSAVGTGATSGTVVPLFVGSRQVDLLPLRGGQRELIADGNVPVGTYETIRVFFNEASVDYDVGGTTETFSTTNGNLDLAGVDTTTVPGTAILEVDLPNGGIQVDQGETEQVLIDIDLEESLDLQPDATDPTEMTFSPTGRVRALADDTTGGSIQGVVRSNAGTGGNTGDDTPVANAKVSLFADGTTTDPIAVTRTDAQGAYVIEGVEAGDYDLLVEDDGFTGQTIDTTITAGQQTTEDVLLVPVVN